MTALEISRKNYNKFEDKKEITELNNALLSVESDFAKRNKEGYKLKGEFEEGVFSAVVNVMRNEFISNKRKSIQIKNFCIGILNEMQY